LENNRDSDFRFHVISRDLSDKSRKKIVGLAGGYKNFTVNFATPDAKLFEGLKLTISHISIDTYYRYAIANMFPEIDKGLYLDADLIVTDKLDGLMAIDISKDYAAGVRCSYIEKHNHRQQYKKKLGLSEDEPYVNAGVLLLNLAKIRNDNMLDALLTTEPLDFQDQDAINIAFRGKILELPDIWNLCRSAVTPKKLKMAAIIHFSSNKKPWGRSWWYKLSDWYRHPEFLMWEKYAKIFDTYNSSSSNEEGKSTSASEN